MVVHPFVLALTVRSISLLLPQTFFQPDEFYQALEPAHHLVFGYGYLTWEWRDLPGSKSAGISTVQSLWNEAVVGGRMRGWLWPGVFAGLYKVLQLTSMDSSELLIIMPRLVGVLVAASTDYATYCLSRKLLGPGSTAAALFLSLTSLFNAHLLPRSLSTSPETLLTTLALLYFPLPRPPPVKEVIVDMEGVPISTLMRPPNDKHEEKQVRSEQGEVIKLGDVSEIDFALMDRMSEVDDGRDSLELSVVFASLAICLRPTTLPFWAYMGGELLLHTWSSLGIVAASNTAARCVLPFCATFVCSTLLDYYITGRVFFPTFTFVHRNVFAQISSFYGSTDWTYHLVQSLPILLFPIWAWWIPGFSACILPESMSAKLGLVKSDRPESLRILSRGLTFGITVLSLSPHSEWRFLHPFLPALILFALPPMFRQYMPHHMGMWRLHQSIRAYTRLPQSAFYSCLCLPLIPWLYLNMFHGRAQVEVINVLRRGEAGHVSRLAALMPCHPTPWQSHLHRDIDAWFLTCEPPLEASESQHRTQQDLFYASPVTFIKSTFAHASQKTPRSATEATPSHLILFGDLLHQTDPHSSGTVEHILRDMGYEQVWSMWNGFDMAQDDAKRRGGVRIWGHA
ncbi:GPI mannosyltransferase [Kockovaella imperatae]|uniref:Mannosyltransferase n=1 Tax=Kockovaella imperatae TaxID=4999 RepID=A0A1Y1UBV9_9TREE|nr:GPI mannosyltransferase [Kockovaella imperatae]ORX34966.1 GPI mannosyltransferase [Kockovaella imperatae]